jgi:predicted acetyltransferase
MTAGLVVRSIHPAEIEAAGELVARVFSRGSVRRYERLLYHRLSHLPRKPGFSPGDYQGAFVDGTLVSVMRVVHHTLHYGQSRLRVAGIVDVATDPAHRHQGYSTAVLVDTLTYIAEQGAHLALLYDETNYYRRFGFSPVLPDYSITFDSHPAFPTGTLLTMRPAQPSDLSAMAGLYESQRDGKLMFRRSVDQWRWLFEASVEPPLVVEGTNGTLYGYLWHSGDEIDTTEVVAVSMEATLKLMAQSARTHHAEGKTTVRWVVPPDDAIIVYAIPAVPVTIHAAYYPDRGWLARLMQPQSLVNVLMRELAAQARFVDPSLDASRLVLEVQPDVVTVGMKNQPHGTCRISHRDFIQVMFGALRPAALAVRAKLLPDQVRTLEMLFPPRLAALSAWDWF